VVPGAKDSAEGERGPPGILGPSRTIQLYDVMLDAVRRERSSRLPNPSTQPRGNRAQPRAARERLDAPGNVGDASTTAQPGARLPPPLIPWLAPGCWEDAESVRGAQRWRGGAARLTRGTCRLTR